MYGSGKYGKALYGLYTVVTAAAVSTVLTGSALDERVLRRAVAADAVVSQSTAAPLATLSASATSATASESAAVEVKIENYNGGKSYPIVTSEATAHRVTSFQAASEVVTASTINVSPKLVASAMSAVQTVNIADGAATLLAGAQTAVLTTTTAAGRGIYVTVDDEEADWVPTTPSTEIWVPILDTSAPLWMEKPVNG